MGVAARHVGLRSRRRAPILLRHATSRTPTARAANSR
jgi:hypothetical protein